MILGVNVHDFYDPLAGWTPAFVAALSTGRAVLIPAGDYDLERGALPAFTSGQRMIGEGPTLTRLHFRGATGDAIKLCDQIDYNYSWFSGIENLSVYGRDGGLGAGIALVGGTSCTIRNVIVGGFDVCVDLDGAECASITDLTTWTPFADGRTPNHCIRFCEGPEAGRGFTVPGATNMNRLRNVFLNLGCTDSTIQFGGVGNSIDGFFCNNGHWRVRGQSTSISNGGWEVASGEDPCLFSDENGVACVGLFVDAVWVTRGPLLKMSPSAVIYDLAIDRVISQGAHVIECGSPYNLAGFARLSGAHWGTGRALNLDQPYAELAMAHISEHASGNRKFGFGTLQPQDCLVDVRNPGFQPNHAQVRYGLAGVRWEVKD